MGNTSGAIEMFETVIEHRRVYTGYAFQKNILHGSLFYPGMGQIKFKIEFNPKEL